MPGSRAAEAVRRGQIIKAAYAVAGAKGLDADHPEQLTKVTLAQ